MSLTPSWRKSCSLRRARGMKPNLSVLIGPSQPCANIQPGSAVALAARRTSLPHAAGLSSPALRQAEVLIWRKSHAAPASPSVAPQPCSRTSPPGNLELTSIWPCCMGKGRIDATTYRCLSTGVPSKRGDHFPKRPGGSPVTYTLSNEARAREQTQGPKQNMSGAPSCKFEQCWMIRGGTAKLQHRGQDSASSAQRTEVRCAGPSLSQNR